MSNILVCSVPVPGHTAPMLAVAQHLKSLGHTVTFNTSEDFRDKARSAGLRFVAMTGRANMDDKGMHNARTARNRSAAESKLSVLRASFAETIPDQHQGIQRILKDTPIDLIVIDTMFFGAFPLLLGPKQNRPPVVTCGVNPLMLTSHDCGLTSPPDSTPEGRWRIVKENQQLRAAFQPITDCINLMMSTCGAPPLPHFFIDCMYLLPDAFLQFTAEEFEFPRSDMPHKVRFAGPMLPAKSIEFEEPDWFTKLDPSRPVVAVTQGTLANDELDELIQPTLSGLADEPLTVIVAAGRSDTQAISAPANARIASFIPFDRLLPNVDVFITNGGYGAVNHALSLGIPIVVAGDTEDKDFVAARIGWSGAGINLKTRHASPEQIRTAVRTILADKQYRKEAQRLKAAFARYSAKDEITNTVEAVLTHGKAAELFSFR